MKVNSKEKVDIGYFKKKTIVKKELVSGIIVPSKEIELKSRMSGVLREMYVQIGQKIKKGDKLVKVEIIASPENIELSKKNVSVSKINYENEKLNYDRAILLFKDELISKEDFEKVNKNFLLSKTEYESAKEQLKITRNGFSGKQKISNIITATSNGTILNLPLKEGSSITERNNITDGTTIAKIADLDLLIFNAEINENIVKYLDHNLKFKVRLNAFEDFLINANLIRVYPEGNIENGVTKFKIDASLQIPEKLKNHMRTNYSAVGEIIIQKKENILVVDEKHILLKYEEEGIEIINSDGEIEWVKLDLGLSDGIVSEVLNKQFDEETRIKIQEY